MKQKKYIERVIRTAKGGRNKNKRNTTKKRKKVIKHGVLNAKVNINT